MIKVINIKDVVAAEGVDIDLSFHGRYVIVGDDDYRTYKACHSYRDAMVQLKKIYRDGSSRYPAQHYEIFKTSDSFYDAFFMVGDAIIFGSHLFLAGLVAMFVSIIPGFIYMKLHEHLPYSYEWIAGVVGLPILIVLTYIVYRFKRYDRDDGDFGENLDRVVFTMASNFVFIGLFYFFFLKDQL